MAKDQITVEPSDPPEVVLLKVLTILERSGELPVEQLALVPGLREHREAEKVLDSAAADGIIQLHDDNSVVSIGEFGRAVANDIRQHLGGHR